MLPVEKCIVLQAMTSFQKDFEQKCFVIPVKKIYNY